MLPKQGFVIAIDGPAASGKTTVTKALAERLSFNYIDTGALYRAVAYLTYQQITSPDDPNLAHIAENAAQENHFEFQKDRLLLNGKDISDFLRSPEVSQLASKISILPAVRSCLKGLQRHLGCQGNAILEGRDIGTVIFPDADLKIYLFASLAHRSLRRHQQLQNDSLNLETVQKEIDERDQRDIKRPIAPLLKAKDAIAFDTSELSMEQVIQTLEHLVKTAVGAS